MAASPTALTSCLSPPPLLGGLLSKSQKWATLPVCEARGLPHSPLCPERVWLVLEVVEVGDRVLAWNTFLAFQHL